MRARAIISLVLPLVVGCATSRPVQPPPRTGTAVAASFSRTWNAMQTVVTEEDIPIWSSDRKHGIVIAEDQPVPPGVDSIADCGRALRTRVRPVRARWELLVRGDSVNSVVWATVRFVDPTGDECASQGLWERAIEERIKTLAEVP